MAKITVGIPKTDYSTKTGWQEFITYLLGDDAETINLDPWVNKPGKKCNELLLPEHVDIVIFDGGVDVHPILYKESKHPATVSNILRDWTELIIFQRYFNLPTKFAGICRGAQFLNVMMGGNLYQDLRSIKMAHAGQHLSQLMPESKFFQFLGKETIHVNSLHHQAIKELGQNLRTTMIHPVFKTIEGIESIKGDKIRAVQSHPEYASKIYKTRIEVMNWLLRNE